MLSMVIKNAETNLKSREFQKDMLVTISKAVARMKSLISKISSLPDKLELKLQMIEVNNLITKVLNDLKISEIPNIKVEKKFQEATFFVWKALQRRSPCCIVTCSLLGVVGFGVTCAPKSRTSGTRKAPKVLFIDS